MTGGESTKRSPKKSMDPVIARALAALADDDSSGSSSSDENSGDSNNHKKRSFPDVGSGSDDADCAPEKKSKLAVPFANAPGGSRPGGNGENNTRAEGNESESDDEVEIIDAKELNVAPKTKEINQGRDAKDKSPTNKPSSEVNESCGEAHQNDNACDTAGDATAAAGTTSGSNDTAQKDNSGANTNASTDSSGSKQQSTPMMVNRQHQTTNDTAKESSPSKQNDNNQLSQHSDALNEEVGDNSDKDDGDGEEEIVLPHSIGSAYSDPLSMLMSTPFHSKAMRSLHKGKCKMQKPSVNLDSVTILHQKKYIQLKREKKPAENHTENLPGRVGAVKKAAATVAAVSRFLLDEGKKLIDSPISSPESSEDEGNPVFQNGISAQSVQKKRKPTFARAAMANSQPETPSHGQSYRNQPLCSDNSRAFSQRQRAALQFSQRQRAEHQPDQQHHRNVHLPQQPTNYHNHHTSMSYASPTYTSVGNNNAKKYMLPNKSVATARNNYQQEEQRRSPQPVAALLPAANRAHQTNGQQTKNHISSRAAHNQQNNQVSRSNQNSQMAQSNNSETLPNSDNSQKERQKATATAVATSKKKLAKQDFNAVTKLPVAFGFSLDDNDVSKKAATNASKQWIEGGESQEKGTSGSATKSSLKTPTSSSKVSTAASKSPASVDTNDTDLPQGWITKTHKRLSGTMAGQTYCTFHSPVANIKFRSMKKLRIFVAILNEPEINGDENAALEEFKARGNKL